MLQLLFGFNIIESIKLVKNKDDITYLNISSYINQHNKKEEKIIVVGNQCLIYLLTNTEASSKYAYQYPIATIDEKIKEEFIKDLKSGEAKIIVNITKFDKDIEQIIMELIDNDLYKKSEKYDFILLKKGDI